MVDADLAASAARVQPEERTAKRCGSSIGDLMGVDPNLEKCLLHVQAGMGSGGPDLPPLQVNQPSLRRPASLGESYKAERAAGRDEVCQLAGINIKHHVRRIIALKRGVRNLSGRERVNEAIRGLLKSIKKQECFHLTGGISPAGNIQVDACSSSESKGLRSEPILVDDVSAGLRHHRQ